MTSTQIKENVSNILVENWSPLDPAAPILHHLPFKIGHTGHALVSKYLLIKESKSSEESSTIEESKEPISTLTSLRASKRTILISIKLNALLLASSDRIED
jgi:hypothetical protein